MSWKRIIVSSTLTILILCCFRSFIFDYSLKPIPVEIEVYADKNILLECFYTCQAKEDFVAGKSVQYLFQPQDSGLIRINLPVEHLHRLRLDLGEYPGKVRLGNLHIPGHTSLGYETGVSFSNIDNVIINQEGIELNSVQEDPYLVFKEPLNIDAKHSLSIGKSGFLIALIISFIAFALFYKLFSFLEKLRLSPPDLVLVAVFFALLPLPAAKINRAELSVAENRTLAKFPALIVENKINNNIGTAFETWFNDRFFMRKQLVGLYNKTTSRINRNLFKEKVLVGKEGWSFNINDDGISNYQNIKLFSDKELKMLTLYLSSIDDWCKLHHKKFYFFVAPDNHKIYGDYFRFVKKIKPDTESRIFQLIRYLEQNSSVEIIYPYHAFLAAKKDEILLYYKNDAHWTNYGAYLGYKELMKAIQKDFLIAPINNKELDTYLHPYGESNLLYPSSIPLDSMTVYHKLRLEKHYTANQREHITEDLYLNNITGHGSLFMLRDSFGNSLESFLGNTFEQVVMKWRYNITREDLHYIEEKDVDIVVLLAVERLVPSILYSSFPKD